MDINRSQAAQFMGLNDGLVTAEQLLKAGVENRGDLWVFRDGSRGRMGPYQDRFVAVDWNLGAMVTVRVQPPLTEDELYAAWDEYQATGSYPKLVFIDEGTGLVKIAFHPDHGNLPGIENIGQAVAMAVHRKYPERQIG